MRFHIADAMLDICNGVLPMSHEDYLSGAVTLEAGVARAGDGKWSSLNSQGTVEVNLGFRSRAVNCW